MGLLSAVMSIALKVIAIALLVLNVYWQDVRVNIAAVLIWVMAAEQWLEYKVDRVREEVRRRG